MKRIISIIIMCAMLTSCGNAYEYENAEAPAVSRTESATRAAEEKNNEIGEISYEVTEEISSDMTSPSSQPAKDTAGSRSEPKITETQETEAVSDNTKEENEPVFSDKTVQKKEHQTVTSCTTKATVTAAVSAKSVKTTSQTITTTTIKNNQTEAVRKTEPPAIEPVTEPITIPEIIEEIKPENDGTDYEKALAIYEYMLENGSGTCVNYACMTYELCIEKGLECLIVWTDSGIYGHVANAVCVDGIWFILDTQGECFLDSNYGFTEAVDIDGNHVSDCSFISEISYEKKE